MQTPDKANHHGPQGRSAQGRAARTSTGDLSRAATRGPSTGRAAGAAPTAATAHRSTRGRGRTWLNTAGPEPGPRLPDCNADTHAEPGKRKHPLADGFGSESAASRPGAWGTAAAIPGGKETPAERSPLKPESGGPASSTTKVPGTRGQGPHRRVAAARWEGRRTAPKNRPQPQQRLGPPAGELLAGGVSHPADAHSTRVDQVRPRTQAVASAPRGFARQQARASTLKRGAHQCNRVPGSSSRQTQGTQGAGRGGVRPARAEGQVAPPARDQRTPGTTGTPDDQARVAGRLAAISEARFCRSRPSGWKPSRLEYDVITGRSTPVIIFEQQTRMGAWLVEGWGNKT